MSLLTPFGPLDDLRLDDIESLKEILVRSDKSRMLEGLVIEAVFQEYLSRLAGQGVELLPVSLVRTLRVRKEHGRKVFLNSWWIWDRSTGARHAVELRNQLVGFAPRAETVFEVRYDEGSRDFFTRYIQDDPEIPVQALLLQVRRQELPKFQTPAPRVIDQLRSQQAFWSAVSSYGGKDFFKKVVLHRLFKNYAIQPFFNGVWDVDCLACLADGSILQLEVKHKYPRIDRPDGSLSFGINDGQLRMMLDLAKRGIKTLYMVMVKPRWDKSCGPGYLLNRVGERSKVLLLAKLLNEHDIKELMRRPSSPTGAEQSLTGQTQQNVRYVKAVEFDLLGTLDDPVDQLSNNIRLAAEGKLHNSVSDELLHSCRIRDEQYM